MSPHVVLNLLNKLMKSLRCEAAHKFSKADNCNIAGSKNVLHEIFL